MYSRVLSTNVTNQFATVTTKKESGVAIIVDAAADYQGATLSILYRPKGSSTFKVLDATLVAGDQQTYTVGADMEIGVTVSGAGSPAPSIPIVINNIPAG